MTTRNKERPKKSDAKTRVVLLALRKTLFHAILDNFILLQFLALLFVLAAVYWSAAIGETLPAILAGFMLAIITVMNGVKRGDLIALRSAGAYGEIMASGYNCRELPQGYTSDELV